MRAIWPWLLAVGGLALLVLAFALRPAEAASAARQNWSPFVLVAGLLLIGLVADADGVFRAAGAWLATAARSSVVLFAGACLLTGLTTALLNLDTSVAFLTPVFVYVAKSRATRAVSLLIVSILLSNAASLFLPGSNLTNLIVLGDRHVTGASFFAHMWLPALCAMVVTALVVALAQGELSATTTVVLAPARGPSFRLGLVATVVAALVVLVVPSPAIPVAVVGVLAMAVRLAQHEARLDHVLETLGFPVLVGLFGVAVGLGTLGRAWSGPSALLAHLDPWGTAALGGVAAVAVNNLPAASLLSAHAPKHLYSLLIGLNLGPNALVTGSLAWVLWLKAARTAGAHPPLARAIRIGLVAAPLSIVVAVGALLLTGSS
jgi:arsenical pump membrane protein